MKINLKCSLNVEFCLYEINKSLFVQRKLNINFRKITQKLLEKILEQCQFYIYSTYQNENILEILHLSL